jgi:hypothetical protein
MYIVMALEEIIIVLENAISDFVDLVLDIIDVAGFVLFLLISFWVFAVRDLLEEISKTIQRIIGR